MRHSLLLIAALASSVLSQSQDPGPSPTASVGCEPHGDHWHCDGPASTHAMTTSTATHHTHEHSHEHTTATPTVPSPTASVGCEPHGDHWHCDGPVETSSTSDAAAASSTGSGEENGAGMLAVRFSSVVGLAMGVAALCM